MAMIEIASSLSSEQVTEVQWKLQTAHLDSGKITGGQKAKSNLRRLPDDPVGQSCANLSSHDQLYNVG